VLRLQGTKLVIIAMGEIKIINGMGKISPSIRLFHQQELNEYMHMHINITAFICIAFHPSVIVGRGEVRADTASPLFEGGDASLRIGIGDGGRASYHKIG